MLSGKTDGVLRMRARVNFQYAERADGVLRIEAERNCDGSRIRFSAFYPLTGIQHEFGRSGIRFSA